MTPTLCRAPVLAVATLLLGCGGPVTPPVAESPSGADEEAQVVHLDSTAIATAGIRLDTVGLVSGSRLAVTGTVTYAADLVSYIGARTTGRVLRVNADIGDRVTEGQVLAVLESPEVGELRSEATMAEALLEIARENFEREQRLEAQGIASRRERLEAEADWRRSEARVAGTRARLQALGASGGESGQFTVTSPFAGRVIERELTRGAMVAPADRLYVVADLRKIWVLLDIFERDLAMMRQGAEVTLTTPAWPDRTFRGRIAYRAPVLDTTTRTVRARIEVPNADGALLPGMFVTARIAGEGETSPSIAIPRAALQELGGRPVVFVPGDEPGSFRPIPITIGAEIPGGLVLVTSGLASGDSIVVAGAFLLRSELAAGEVGDHGH